MPDELDKADFQNLFSGAMEIAREPGLQEQLATTQLRYERIGDFGTGGRKRVIHARDRYTGREIALAVLKPPFTDDDGERFLREARMLSHLQHPSIIPIYDVGVSDEYGPYFVMKPAEPATFNTIVKALRGARSDDDTQWPLALRLDLFSRVCQGISYAHNHGILHLDLKPANILLGQFGEALVSDWGIARKLDDPESQDFFEDEELETSRVKLVTKHGLVRGTPGYMAPEQMLAKDTTPATDVYGLGGILYALLTSLPPVAGGSYGEIEHATLQGSIVRPSIKRPDLQIPSSLDAIVMKALSRKPEDRYLSVDALIRDLEQFRTGYAPTAYDASSLDQIRLAYSRNKAVINGLMAAAVILCIVAGIFILQLKKEQSAALSAKAQAIASLEKEAAQNAKNQELLAALKQANEKNLARSHQLAVRFVEDANKALKVPDYRRALTLLDSAVGLAPDLLAARQLRGDLLLASGRIGEAAADYRTLPTSANNTLEGLAQRTLEIPDSSPHAIRDRFRNIWIGLMHQNRKDLIRASMALANLNRLPPITNAEVRLEMLKLQNPKQKKWSPKISNNDDVLLIDLSGHGKLTNLNALSDAPIHVLDISGAAVQPDHLRVLRTTKIHTLIFKRASFAYGKELALPNLRVGDFSNSKLKWVTAFSQVPIEVLNVSGTPVGDFASLQESQTLQRIIVGQKQAQQANVLAPKVRIQVSD